MKPLRLKRADLPKRLRATVPKGPNKFNAQPQKRDGRRIASTAEARRLAELKLEERAGGISDLRTQVKFPLRCNGHDLEAYVADFTYTRGGVLVVEDVKGFRTPLYKLKRKLMRAVHGIEIREVR